MTASAQPTAAVLIVGNEILSGRTKDVNLAWLGERLSELGIEVVEARVVADDENAIVGALRALKTRASHVFTTGGIGPTHDDITAECVAKCFGVPLLRNPEAVRRLQVHYESTATSTLNEARLRMANIPEGATLIDNPVSAAPGFQIGNVFVMAGVPRIMQGMFETLVPRLAPGLPFHSRTVTCSLPEGEIAAELGEIQQAFPEVRIGSYPYYRPGGYGVSLVARSRDAETLAACIDAIAGMVHARGDRPILSDGAHRPAG